MARAAGLAGAQVPFAARRGPVSGRPWSREDKTWICDEGGRGRTGALGAVGLVQDRKGCVCGRK